MFSALGSEDHALPYAPAPSCRVISDPELERRPNAALRNAGSSESELRHMFGGTDQEGASDPPLTPVDLWGCSFLRAPKSP